jgi:hypothetical protein
VSGGLAYPSMVRVPAPTTGPSIVRIPAPAAPSVVRLETPGIPGPPGPVGAAGPTGITTGLGVITYSHQVADPNSVDPAVMGSPLDANAPLQLVFVPDPNLTLDHLNAPFVGQTFWDGTKVVGRAMADRLEVQVNLIVRSQRAGGTISLEVDAGSPFGPITSDNADLLKPAGVNERVTLTVKFETLTYVQANGAKLMLTSDVPASIFKESVVVAPQSTFVPRTP